MKNVMFKMMNLLLCLGFLLSGVAVSAPVAASSARQAESDGHGNYWRHYNTANSNLLSNKIQAIAYTEDPLVDIDLPGLWIGTDAGISYTNGRDWMDYTVETQNFASLPSNDVRAIITSTNLSELWIGTAGGIARLDYGATPRDRADDVWQTFTTADGLGANYVWALWGDAATGVVWADAAYAVGSGG